MRNNQEYQYGDWIKVDDDLGPSMKHFTSGVEAIVIGSYEDLCGGTSDTNRKYNLYLKGKGKSAWYYEDQLTLIERERSDMLDKWEIDAISTEAFESSLDWIFANGEEVISNPSGTSVRTLADALGLLSDGVFWSHETMVLSKPFLSPESRNGWLNACDEYKKSSLRDSAGY